MQVDEHVGGESDAGGCVDEQVVGHILCSLMQVDEHVGGSLYASDFVDSRMLGSFYIGGLCR